MVFLKPGDRVIIKLKESKLTDAYSVDFDDSKIFEIIATEGNGYYLFIPHYIFIHDTKKVDKYLQKDLKIHSKYLGEDVLYVSEGKVYKIFSTLNGLSCSSCSEFYEYAKANQDDGTLICWSCKKS